MTKVDLFLDILIISLEVVEQFEFVLIRSYCVLVTGFC